MYRSCAIAILIVLSGCSSPAEWRKVPRLALDLNHVAEPHRFEHLAITGFNVDAVVKIEAALVFDRLGNRDPCGFSRVVLGRFKVRQFNALFIWSINVIEQMEVEPRHVTKTLGGPQSCYSRTCTYAKGINVQQNLRTGCSTVTLAVFIPRRTQRKRLLRFYVCFRPIPAISMAHCRTSNFC